MGEVLQLGVSLKIEKSFVTYNGERIPIIKYEHIPKAVIGPFVHYKTDDINEYLFSLYRGVAIQWDEDFDTRVLIFIDEMERGHREKLLSVWEHQGCLSFLWKGYVPPKYREGFYSESIEVYGDIWGIFKSCEDTHARQYFNENPGQDAPCRASDTLNLMVIGIFSLIGIVGNSHLKCRTQDGEFNVTEIVFGNTPRDIDGIPDSGQREHLVEAKR